MSNDKNSLFIKDEVEETADEILAKYKLYRNVYFLTIFLTIVGILIKLFFHKNSIYYYGVEAIAFLFNFVYLLINLFSKNSNTDIAVKKKIFYTMWTNMLWIYFIGPFLIIILYPQKVLIAGLYIPIGFISVVFYIFMILKNKKLIEQQDLKCFQNMAASKVHLAVSALLFGLISECLFSFFVHKDFNIIAALLLGASWGILTYIIFSRFTRD